MGRESKFIHSLTKTCLVARAQSSSWLWEAGDNAYLLREQTQRKGHPGQNRVRASKLVQAPPEEPPFRLIEEKATAG